MMDWIEDNLGWISVVLIFALVIGAITWLAHAINADHERNCTALYAMSRTSHDSLEVAMRCTLGDGSNTAVVPVVVPIR